MSSGNFWVDVTNHALQHTIKEHNDHHASEEVKKDLHAMRGAKASIAISAPIFLGLGAPVAVAGGLALAIGWGVRAALKNK